ncbi:UbiX family flavin prenyltransferase [Alteribacillus sp. YIM 98480]|uniref:UbiX family flavin prenyltransferase n=1 Tax=Alteribacillus sp. YIM 98480 TaxID=2606599 RepID=UPI00131E9CE3|nr:UbiX family flavin prenyltransferase [Alteribacillus sp. YIM 98480]
MKKIIVAITGGSGAIYGIRTLQLLRELGAETHLIISAWGSKTIQMETSYTVNEVKEMASVHYHSGNQAADVSSGSFKVDGMIVAPCSMKTLASITSGMASDLVSRSADVMLKEQKKLILLARETPLNLIHVRNMETAILSGAMIFPPVPAFYNNPESLDDVINHTVGRVLDQFGYDPEWLKRWGEPSKHSNT